MSWPQRSARSFSPPTWVTTNWALACLSQNSNTRFAAQHLNLSLERSSGGAVKVDYGTEGTTLSFDLLAALRAGQIISIRGDRIVGDVACLATNFFRRQIFMPTGPFVLSLVAETRIYPLFIVRIGFRKYRIIAREPIMCSKSDRPREEEIASAMRRWSQLLEETVGRYWHQRYAFTPTFEVAGVMD